MPIEPFNSQFIEEVGFPIAAFIAGFGIISTIMILIIKSQIKRQELFDTQYFKSMKDVHDELAKIALETRTISTKIDTYINKLDLHFDNKNVAYIFREGKIDEIKNIIEEKDVTKYIERKVRSDENRKNKDDNLNNIVKETINI